MIPVPGHCPSRPQSHCPSADTDTVHCSHGVPGQSVECPAVTQCVPVRPVLLFDILQIADQIVTLCLDEVFLWVRHLHEHDLAQVTEHRGIHLQTDNMVITTVKQGDMGIITGIMGHRYCDWKTED